MRRNRPPRHLAAAAERASARLNIGFTNPERLLCFGNTEPLNVTQYQDSATFIAMAEAGYRGLAKAVTWPASSNSLMRKSVALAVLATLENVGSDHSYPLT
jgi:hypothetical protein